MLGSVGRKHKLLSPLAFCVRCQYLVDALSIYGYLRTEWCVRAVECGFSGRIDPPMVRESKLHTEGTVEQHR